MAPDGKIRWKFDISDVEFVENDRSLGILRNGSISLKKWRRGGGRGIKNLIQADPFTSMHIKGVLVRVHCLQTLDAAT